jgi:hypothetical protein
LLTVVFSLLHDAAGEIFMKLKAISLCAAAIALFAVSGPVFGEHSFAAEFDNAARVSVKGVVTKVEWTSPNMFIYVDMKDAKTGRMKNWTIEMNCANSLKAGWTRDSLKVGMTLLVPDAARARDGSNKVHPASIQVAGAVLPSGR